MRKAGKWIVVAVILGALVYMGSIVSDKAQLSDQVLRLHVVANSDTAEDQAVKLLVRDAVNAQLQRITDGAQTKEQAQGLISAQLSLLESAANEVLEQQGFEERASVSLGREAFPKRHYDTFTLPAGVYDSLRVTIGEGQGQNWWCVVFPGLCVPAATQGVQDTAAGAGFSEGLSGAITGASEYEVRFLLLDWLGRIENYFWKG